MGVFKNYTKWLPAYSLYAVYEGAVCLSCRLKQDTLTAQMAGALNGWSCSPTVSGHSSSNTPEQTAQPLIKNLDLELKSNIIYTD